MGKKKRDVGISLDSFLDILTCLQGVLMLIIITTGIDAAQTKVILATPIELTGGERPVFIEARSNMLYRVPVEDARRAVLERQADLLQKRRSAPGSASGLDLHQPCGLLNPAEHLLDPLPGVDRLDVGLMANGAFVN